MFLTAAYELIAPDQPPVLAAINRSTAKKYLEDPVGTLRSLKPSQSDIIRLPGTEDENTPPNAE
jgi:hypothetical protein